MPSFLRVLFPTWRFFEDLGSTPRLFYRTKNVSGQMSPWIPALRPMERKLISVFFNPVGNFELACNSLLERALQEISDSSEKELQNINQTLTYRLLCNLIEFELKKSDSSQSFLNYQFKIVVREKNGNHYEALISEEHGVSLGV